MSVFKNPTPFPTFPRIRGGVGGAAKHFFNTLMGQPLALKGICTIIVSYGLVQKTAVSLQSCSGIRHTNDDIPLFLIGLNIPVRRGGLRQWITSVDNRFQRTNFDKMGEK